MKDTESSCSHASSLTLNEMIEPPRVTAGEPCPRVGLLRITLPNGTQSLTRPTESGGVKLDFGADGLVCLPCSFGCTADVRRCAALHDPGVCEDVIH